MPLTARKRVFLPDSKKLKAKRKSLPRFDPLELAELSKRPPAHDDPEDHFARLARIVQRETNHQMLELLRRLGVDEEQPDAWRKGFFWLAYYHHRVGHFVYYRSKKHRNAAKWTEEHDLALLSETMKLRATGLSELAAVKKIASHPELKRLLPYRAQRIRAIGDSKATERKKRAAALHRRLQELKSKASERSLLVQLLGPDWDMVS
jgi:hypothetical protein